jgi:putative serine protease PepD
MSFLAVSLGWLIIQPVGANQQEALWNRVQRSVAVASQGGLATGVGVLLDPAGTFLFQRSGLSGSQPWNVTIAGKSIQVTLVAEDEETGLALVRSPQWNSAYGSPIRMAADGPIKGDRILAVTPRGPRTAQVSEGLIVGQLKPSLRYVPLSEIKLEDMSGQIAGSAAFNGRGELVGMISALQAEAPSSSGRGGRSGSGFAAPGALKSADDSLKILMMENSSKFGPGVLTVGYAYGPDLLDRVFSGLSSPSGRVQHPSIGIFFKKAAEGGAALEAVMPGSPAADAGLKVGDVILSAAGSKVAGPVELAVILFNQKVGGTITLKVRRGQSVSDVNVVVGVQASDESLKSSISQRKLERPL